MTDAPKPKPLIAAAFTCERIMQEADGVISAIRIVDTFNVTLPGDAPENIKVGINPWVIVYLKSGDAIGRYTVSFVMRPPEGKPGPLGQPIDIDLTGGANGATIAFELTMIVRTAGLYWIDVLVDGERLTSIPITLQRIRA